MGLLVVGIGRDVVMTVGPGVVGKGRVVVMNVGFGVVGMIRVGVSGKTEEYVLVRTAGGSALVGPMLA